MRPIFDGLEPLDLAWFDMGRGKIPIACTGRYLTVNPAREAQPLADECDPHGYLTKPGDILKDSGHPVVEIRMGKGLVVASEMNLGAKDIDPVAGRVLANMVRYLEGAGGR